MPDAWGMPGGEGKGGMLKLRLADTLSVWSYDSHTIYSSKTILKQDDSYTMYNCLLATETSPLSLSRFHINEINIHDISFKTNRKRVAKKNISPSNINNS